MNEMEATMEFRRAVSVSLNVFSHQSNSAVTGLLSLRKKLSTPFFTCLICRTRTEITLSFTCPADGRMVVSSCYSSDWTHRVIDSRDHASVMVGLKREEVIA